MSKVVLIADDDEADVYFLTDAFKAACPEAAVRSVSDGQAAVDYLAGTGKYADRKAFPFPTHVFLDLKMPLLSGIEVLEWLRRQSGELGRLPVTVLSGSDLAADVEQARALGAEYAVKPVEYAALLAEVRGFCRRYLS